MPTIIYPPTVEYDFLMQRPAQLMRSFARKGLKSILLNINQGQSGRVRAGVEEIEKDFYVVSNPVNLLVEPPVILYYTYPPHYFGYRGRFRENLLIFDSIDEPALEFSHWQWGYTESLAGADIVLASSESLYRKAARINRNAVKVPNGVDFPHFHKASGRNLKIPREMKGLRGPIVGFYGCIAGWVDTELIREAAGNLPECTFVVIGPGPDLEPPSNGNLRRIGHVPYDSLPGYLQMFDVCLLPFKVNRMTEGCNPIKVWEYLAAGKPVVSTALPETKGMPGVYRAESREGFVDCIRKALAETGEALRKSRIRFARDNSWDHRADQVMAKIEEVTGWRLQR